MSTQALKMIKKVYHKAVRLYERARHKARTLRYGSDLNNIAILLTSPRSGSTWLFDVLRCHPAITMHPRFLVYRELHLRGRRYPRDLSNKSNAAMLVETRPGEWDQIPDPGANLSISTDTDRRYNVEKIHPHFFGHDVASFLERIERLSQQCNVVFLYQVRDPRETLTSFLEYKRRNPSWDHRDPSDIPAHLRRIFESISEVVAHVGGGVIDYATLKTDFDETVRSVCAHLFNDSGLSSSDLSSMRHATSRNQKKANTTFIGSEESSEYVEDYSRYFQRHEEEIDRCYYAYDEITSEM